MVKRAGYVGAVAGLTLGLAGCSSSGVIGDNNAGTLSGMSHVLPGKTVDSVALLENHSGHPVTLRSATILPLGGFHAPRLMAVAVETHGRTARGLMSGGEVTGWPNSQLHVARLRGYELPSDASSDRGIAFTAFAMNRAFNASIALQ